MRDCRLRLHYNRHLNNNNFIPRHATQSHRFKPSKSLYDTEQPINISKYIFFFVNPYSCTQKTTRPNAMMPTDILRGINLKKII